MANPQLKPSYVIKIKEKKDLLDGDYGMAYMLFNKHPAWCGNYRVVYKDTKSSLDFIEGDKRFICFEYLYSIKLTLDEALDVCPEVLI